MALCLLFTSDCSCLESPARKVALRSRGLSESYGSLFSVLTMPALNFVSDIAVHDLELLLLV